MNDNLYLDIDNMCMTLKHGFDTDPHEIRTLLRRAQAAVEILDSISMYGSIAINKKDIDGYIENHVSLGAVLTGEQVKELLLYIAGYWHEGNNNG